MRQSVCCAVVPLLAVLVAGCGDGRLKTRGQVLKDGTPYAVEETDVVRVTFVPLPDDGAKVLDWHTAVFKKADGTFVAFGKDGRGVPPGKYRIAVEHLRHKKDMLNGAFDPEKSPFVREVRSSADTLTLDLAKPS
jgi:hypothetical protein